jgi:ADP-ribosyl-[dinitrogen reductase] hydrolase
MSLESRSVGCLLGLACGDALGRPVEFQSSIAISEEYGRVTEMYGDGTHGKPAGTVTDDTDLALGIAHSLVECGEFNGADVAQRFAEWYESDPFDVGLMTADAISRLQSGESWREAGQRVWESRAEGSNAGNGSLMRCAPHALAFHDDHARLAEVAAASSKITHADPRCVEGCVALTRVIAELLDGADPEAAATAALSLAADRDAPREIRTALANAPDRDDATLETTGYVVHTLETGLHEGLTASSAEDGIVSAVSRGGDADTVGAVAGAVAGARFGADALPDRWLDVLDEEATIRAVGTELATL